MEPASIILVIALALNFIRKLNEMLQNFKITLQFLRNSRLQIKELNEHILKLESHRTSKNGILEQGEVKSVQDLSRKYHQDFSRLDTLIFNLYGQNGGILGNFDGLKRQFASKKKLEGRIIALNKSAEEYVDYYDKKFNSKSSSSRAGPESVRKGPSNATDLLSAQIGEWNVLEANSPLLDLDEEILDEVSELASLDEVSELVSLDGVSGMTSLDGVSELTSLGEVSELASLNLDLSD